MGLVTLIKEKSIRGKDSTQALEKKWGHMIEVFTTAKEFPKTLTVENEENYDQDEQAQLRINNFNESCGEEYIELLSLILDDSILAHSDFEQLIKAFTEGTDQIYMI